MAMPPDHTNISMSTSLPSTEKTEEVRPVQMSIDSPEKMSTEDNDGSGSNTFKSFLEMEEGPDIMYGPKENPERTNSPIVMYGPMNNASGEDYTSERFSKDLKDSTACAGQCGLYNLGNTCFMNAGLQSLMATPPVIRYFLQHHSEAVGSHNLAEQFSVFVTKFWSGNFSILYPKDLKTALGHIHGQFKDYRQHDCQEFLALLLDTLNDQTKVGPNTPFFITHNDLNNSQTQAASALDQHTLEQQQVSVSMETTSNNAQSQSEEDEMFPMPLTQLKVSTDGELLEDLHLNNTSIFKKKMPSIEKFYAKETKTLNTNVLISESPEESLNFDSSKYAKAENCPVVHNDIGVSHVVNEPMVVMDLKRCRVSPKGVKDINIYADMCNKNVNMYCDAYEENEKVKRSKFDTFEKNFQHQAFSKLNCLPERPDETDCLSGKGTKDKKMNEKHHIVTMDSSNQSMANQDVISEKVNIHLQFKDNNEQRQDMCLGGAVNDAEIDQDTDSVDAIEQDEDEDVDTEQDPSEKVNMEEDLEDGEWDNDKLMRLADKRWMDHIMDNQSVIVKTFHGQYQSSVTCGECSHVSVTFEPFMYLSVPLPRANERQLCVMYLSVDNTPTQYLMTMDKRDRISKVKDILRHMTKTDNNIIMAEVLDHHVARIVDDTTMLRYINSSSRKLYAFEITPFAAMLGSGIETQDSSVTSMTSAANKENDIFSQVGTFTASNMYRDFGSSSFASGTACKVNDNFVESVVSPDVVIENGWGTDSTLQYSWPKENTKISIDSKESEVINGTTDFTIGQWSLQEGSTPLAVDEVSDVQWSSVTTLEDDDKQLTADQNKVSPDLSKDRVVTVDQWKSCSICLEELADSELLVHKTCGATFCHSCLEMSLLHYGQENFLCPVCSCAAVMTEDFTQLADSDKNNEERMLLVDVTFCQTVQEQRNLLGHPRVLYLSSQMFGAQLYECIEQIVPDACQFNLLTTDAQGSRCSRCVYTAKCTGCMLPRDGQVSLRPGDTLCVCLDDVQLSVIERMESSVDHPSMMDLRPTLPLSIYDCIQAFTESETLDKHNPWFCPRCQQNQCASKSMTVWRYPDVLIIHLKRFVYHEMVSVKVDSEVDFPLEGLCLPRHISGPVTCDLTYDLNSIVCHFGDLNSGHYTCFTKHSIDNTWYYYNDENVTQQSPKQQDFKNAYILMYHRRGANFSMPDLPPYNKTEQD
ncbi:uncharacterized protein LOC127739380 [Mytilus californianus]|uniref:uncharacterized protein LOC127739380 n=1 Tax=Mytilus californianus TaxID=6549 RepID=UPI00224723B4|nr:uncharacterized protein LOC127739380 [Mytilus californianus]